MGIASKWMDKTFSNFGIRRSTFWSISLFLFWGDIIKENGENDFWSWPIFQRIFSIDKLICLKCDNKSFYTLLFLLSLLVSLFLYLKNAFDHTKWAVSKDYWRGTLSLCLQDPDALFEELKISWGEVWRYLYRDFNKIS